MLTSITDHDWDVIVIGTGIGGGTIGRRMAENGLKVLFLERGIFDPRDRLAATGASSTVPAAQPATHLRPAPITGTVAGARVSPLTEVGAEVGGTSVFYSAVLERPEPHDIDHSAARPHPTNGWPISHAALSPYFDQAERLYHVCGEADPLAPAPDPALLPAPAMGVGDATLVDWFRSKGLNPYRAHVGIRYLPGCAECRGRKCPLACKMDGRSAGVEPALATGRAALLDDCTVTALRGQAGLVTHVEARRGGQQLRLRARRIVLAAGAFGTPALLLRSASEDWPDGCANESGLVGRNLMFHLSERVAIWPQHRTRFDGPAKTVSMRDFYWVDGRRFGLLQSMGSVAGYGDIVQSLNDRFDGSALRFLRPLRGFSRVPAFASSLIHGAARVFVCIFEDLPYAANRVTLDRSTCDGISFNYDFAPELLQRRQDLRLLLKARLNGRHSFFLSTHPELNIGHCCGTARFGTDAATSVLDPSCRSHSVRNLYVADSSFMPTSNGVNPSLTIAANALRVADKLAQDFAQA